ncbi:MAG: DNA repair protein RadC [Candidatus Moranbacteria bacterium]|nr:DNA repair protein RadC [Candidatus Moranbacteria bacterium]
MARMKDVPKIERPRERMEKYGPEKLKDEELLAILLRTGLKGTNVVTLSKKILRTFKEKGIGEATVAELKTIKGLGAAKACEVVACFELGKRLLKDKRTAVLLTPKDVWERMEDIRGSKKEHFVVFYLDSRSQETRRETVSIGTLDESLVHPREVFESAIRHNASGIIVAHNHPSGDPTSSRADLAVTRRLCDAGNLLGIPLFDHVIVAKECFTSLKEQGIIP